MNMESSYKLIALNLLFIVGLVAFMISKSDYNLTPEYISVCCDVECRVIEDKYGNIKYWCLDCKKWCKLKE